MNQQELLDKGAEARKKLGLGDRTPMGRSIVDLAVGGSPATLKAIFTPQSPTHRAPADMVKLGSTTPDLDPVLTAHSVYVPQAQHEDKTRDLVVTILLRAAAAIATKQEAFDKANRAYTSLLTDLSIQALSEPLFPGKKEGEPLRPASNDAERDLAIQKVAGSHSPLVLLVQDREYTLRELNRERHDFEAAKLVAQLLVAGVQ